MASTSAPSQQRAEEPVVRIYEIKWRSAEEIAKLLRGFADNIFASESFNTITVRSLSKDHEAISALLRKYDVPARTIEFQLYLIKAATVGEGIKDGLPDKIRKVINEVAALTRYKSFELLDAPVLRTSEGKGAQLSGKGFYFYTLFLAPGGAAIVTTEQGKRQIRADNFGINFAIPVGTSEQKPIFKDVGVSTAFTIGDGETVVLGASQIQQEAKESGAAIITVVTAKILD
jgi:type II secretory pathway component GspD/PulD (secretin)